MRKEANERINTLVAEIDSDLSAIEDIEAQVRKLYESIDQTNIENRDRAALGYYLHNLYNAAESILKKIAKFFENSVAGASRHTDLLKRMTLEIEEVRPRVISKNSYEILNELCKFRHVFRHAYDYELRWKRMDELWQEYLEKKNNFIQDIKGIKQLLYKLKETEV